MPAKLCFKRPGFNQSGGGFMRVFVVFLVLFASVLAGAQTRIKSHFLKEISESESYVPAEFALRAVQAVTFSFHTDSDLQVADYKESSFGDRILLYRPYFVVSSGFVKLKDMTPDVAAPFFEAVFLKWVNQERKSNPSYRNWMNSEAQRVYTDIPREKRLEVFLDAQAQWVGHMMSIVILIERSYNRIGNRLCERFETPIFRMWERNFVDTHFFGGYYSRNRWTHTGKNLLREHRVALTSSVFEERWVGQARMDFQRYCEKSLVQ